MRQKARGNRNEERGGEGGSPALPLVPSPLAPRPLPHTGRSLTFHVEPWATFAQEARPLWTEHWQEIALDQDVIPLVPDDGAYEALDAQGMLHVVTARDAGRLAGYWVGIVGPHLHYATTVHARMDVLWLHPDHRRGLAGYRLLKAVEHSLQQRAPGAVVKVLMGTKTHYDLSVLYARLGYTEIERVWSKVLH